MVDKTKDVNGNKLDSRSLVEKLVSSLVDTLGEKYQWYGSKKLALKEKLKEFLYQEIESSEKPCQLGFEPKGLGLGECEILKDLNVMKPFRSGWLRRVSVRPRDKCVTSVCYLSPADSGGRRVRVNNKSEIEKYLKDTKSTDFDVNDFVIGRYLLGLPSEFESTIISRSFAYYTKSDYTEDRFLKPFKLGWLRQVRIRSSDNCVTSVGYLTPPDSDGKRLRFGFKRDIDEFLNKTGNNDLDVKDFAIMRRLLGVSSDFEKITFCQPVPDEKIDSGNIKENATVVDDSSADDDIDSSDSDDSSSNCSDDIVPVSDQVFNNQDYPDISKNIDGSNIIYHTDASLGSKQRALVGEDASSPTELVSASPFSPPIASSSTAANNSLPVIPSSYPVHHQTASPVPTATMVMFSTDPSNREGGKTQKKMKIKCGVKMKKGMQAFGKSFGQDFRKLKFFINGVQLTGDEMAGELDGARIRVEGFD